MNSKNIVFKQFSDGIIRLRYPAYMKRNKCQGGSKNEYLFECSSFSGLPLRSEMLLLQIDLNVNSREAQRSCILQDWVIPSNEQFEVEIVRRGDSNVKSGAIERVSIARHNNPCRVDYEWDVMWECMNRSVYLSLFVTSGSFEDDEHIWKSVIESVGLV